MLLIHVGFYRTGSTFYKKRVFPIIDKNFKYEDNLKIILDNLVYPNSIELNEKKIKNSLNKYMTKNKNTDSLLRVFYRSSFLRWY